MVHVPYFFLPLRRLAAGSVVGAGAGVGAGAVAGRKRMQSSVRHSLGCPWPSSASGAASPQIPWSVRLHHGQEWQPSALTGASQAGHAIMPSASVAIWSARSAASWRRTGSNAATRSLP